MWSHLHWTYPTLLWLLPLALLPLLHFGARRFAYPQLVDWPRDVPSDVVRVLLRAICALTVAALIVAAAGPYLEGGTRTLFGSGAQIVVVLDRSGSMSEPLLGTNEDDKAHTESKIEAARRILLAFMRRRPGDMFGMTTFNASPIGVAPLGEDRELVDAALRSAQSRSEGNTEPASALALALDYFRDRPHDAARVVLLVSDGGAKLSSHNREVLRALFAARDAALIWIYTRGEQEPSIRVPDKLKSENIAMHEFFSTLQTPYEVFEVTSADGLEHAVAEVAHMTNLPSRYEERLPRQDMAGPLYAAALLAILALIGARLFEVRTWEA